MIEKHYIQYHNADKLGRLPFLSADLRESIDSLKLDNKVKYGPQFYTSKKIVEKAVGHYCFLIVGKTEKIKKYYLWSFLKIQDYVKNEKGIYTDVNGVGFDFQKPILLNDLMHFEDFKKFCGNFGIGFQNIDNHVFCSTLLSLSDKSKIENYKSIVQPKPNADLVEALKNLNELMKNVASEKIHVETMKFLRKDKQIVNLLKEVTKYKCQFPNCDALVMTKSGRNYVEVAHIKPVKEGGQSILGNLIVLCPNHHKEFDHGHLTIELQTKNLLKGELNGMLFVIETQKY